MKTPIPTLVSLALALAAATLSAADADIYTQRVAAFKVAQGKTQEFRMLLDEYAKIAQLRANSGEIVSWTVLRSVIPYGTAAKADYLLITSYKGYPTAAKSGDLAEADRIKSGSKLPYADYVRQMSAISTYVSAEIWQYSAAAGGHPQVGDYVLSNSMRVSDSAALTKFENELMKPVAEKAAAAGAIRSWRYYTKLMPSGSDVEYMARTDDIVTSFDGAFTLSQVWSKTIAEVHKGKDFSGLMAEAAKSRKLALREVFQVTMRVEAQKK